MSARVRPVVLHILEKEYRIACPDEERNALTASAAYLDEKMKEIRGTGKVVGTDRIAVMAALNIAHDLLRLQTRSSEHATSLSQRVQALQEKIEQALNASNGAATEPTETETEVPQSPQ